MINLALTIAMNEKMKKHNIKIHNLLSNYYKIAEIYI